MITCDECGKIANVNGKPSSMHWLDWMTDETRGNDAIIVVPSESGLLSAVCFECVSVLVQDWQIQRTDDNILPEA